MRISTFSYFRAFLSGCCIALGMVGLFYLIILQSEIPKQEQTLWVLDTSSSMGIEDISTKKSSVMMSRFDLAKELIETSISGETAMITYARHASVLFPMSTDMMTSRSFVHTLQLTQMNGGSDISSAFELMNMLYAHVKTPIHVILITDGGDTATGTMLPPLPSYARLSIMGLGTKEGGMIPLGYNAIGERRYKLYQGENIRVPLDRAHLEGIAKKYKAPLKILDHQDQVQEAMQAILTSSEKTSNQYSFLFLVIASLSVMIGYMISPYGYVSISPK